MHKTLPRSLHDHPPERSAFIKAEQCRANGQQLMACNPNGSPEWIRGLHMLEEAKHHRARAAALGYAFD
jgi:hypothetical protein